MTTVLLDNLHTDIVVGPGGGAANLLINVSSVLSTVRCRAENLTASHFNFPGDPFSLFAFSGRHYARFLLGGAGGPKTQVGIIVSHAGQSNQPVIAFDGTQDFGGGDTINNLGSQHYLQWSRDRPFQVKIPNTGFTTLYCARENVLTSLTRNGHPLPAAEWARDFTVGGSQWSLSYDWI